MIVHDGSHSWDTDDPNTWVLGKFTRPDGSLILVYRNQNELDLINAYTEAVGPVPQPPMLLSDGGLVPTFENISTDVQGVADSGITQQVISGYVFNPGPTTENTEIVAEYQATISAWNVHAAAQKTILDVLLQYMKGKKQ